MHHRWCWTELVERISMLGFSSARTRNYTRDQPQQNESNFIWCISCFWKSESSTYHHSTPNHFKIPACEACVHAWRCHQVEWWLVRCRFTGRQTSGFGTKLRTSKEQRAISLDKRTKISRKKKPIWVHSPWGHQRSMFSGNVPSTSTHKKQNQTTKRINDIPSSCSWNYFPYSFIFINIFISINFSFFFFSFARHKNVTKHLNRSRAICDSTTITKQENKCCKDLSQKISLLLATCLYFAYAIFGGGDGWLGVVGCRM